jgi:hypothetical protein
VSSLGLEIDLALKRLDALKASRLERLLRDGLALAFADEAPEKQSSTMQSDTRREVFARRFAPLASVPDRDLSDIVSENRGEA